MANLVAYGSYVPRWRLDVAEIGRTLGSGGRAGVRSVASYDEDTTSMAVEAARATLAAAPSAFAPDQLLLATATPAYADKTNATAVHAACALPASTGAFDLNGASRSGIGAILLAQQAAADSLVLCADVRTGLPGGVEEATGGDAAVGLAFAEDAPALAEVLGRASASAEFLDRWRAPGAPASAVWEERFGEAAHQPSAEAAFTEACKLAGVTADEIDHLVVVGLHARAVRTFVAASGVLREKVADDLTRSIGNVGTAQAGLALTGVLDRAAPGEVIVLVHLGDGADSLVLRATEELVAHRDRRGADRGVGTRPVPYASFLTWRGLLDREPPRRPDPAAPAAPPALRHASWKFGLSASRCVACGTLHLPPARVCMTCHAVDRMTPEAVRHLHGTIATYTVDHLTYSLAPPIVGVVVDLDGGGRFVCEIADASPDEVTIGGRVAMTFRRLYTAPNGVHNYGWKARLLGEDTTP